MSRSIKLGFVVNDMATEKDNYTTIRLARTAANRGHEVAIIGLGGFIYDANGTVRAKAHVPRDSDYADDAALLAELQGDDADVHRISVEELDVLMLRSDPAEELEDRPWAPNSGLLFAQLAALKHVIVLNDPTHLTDASNKTYFQHFPEEVRPVTCITLDPDEIKSFIKSHDDCGVIKPLQGSGGQSVFVVTPDSGANLNQMIDAVTRDGYAIVQEYLPKAARATCACSRSTAGRSRSTAATPASGATTTAGTPAATSPPAARSRWPSRMPMPCGWPRSWHPS
jgi:glutathione synthase